MHWLRWSSRCYHLLGRKYLGRCFWRLLRPCFWLRTYLTRYRWICLPATCRKHWATSDFCVTSIAENAIFRHTISSLLAASREGDSSRSRLTHASGSGLRPLLLSNASRPTAYARCNRLAKSSGPNLLSWPLGCNVASARRILGPILRLNSLSWSRRLVIGDPSFSEPPKIVSTLTFKYFLTRAGLNQRLGNRGNSPGLQAAASWRTRSARLATTGASGAPRRSPR